GSDRQKNLLNTFISSVETEGGYEKLKSLIEGRTSLKGLNYDQDLRWATLLQMAQFGQEDLLPLIEKESRRDPSDRGKKSLLSIQAAHPKMETKRKVFQSLMDYIYEKAQPDLGDLRALMGGFFPRRQGSYKVEFAKEYFESLPRLDRIAGSRF